MMKVLLINGSPNAKGCTYTALTEVASTLEAEGIETELIHVGRKDIRGCIGCRKCHTTGKCVFDDLVNETAPKFKEMMLERTSSSTPYFLASSTLRLLSTWAPSEASSSISSKVISCSLVALRILRGSAVKTPSTSV